MIDLLASGDPIAITYTVLMVISAVAGIGVVIHEFRRERRRKAEQVRERVWWGQGR